MAKVRYCCTFGLRARHDILVVIEFGVVEVKDESVVITLVLVQDKIDPALG